MLLQIPGVLNKEEIASVLQELGQGAYEEGRASAGLVAREVKRESLFDPNEILDGLRD